MTCIFCKCDSHLSVSIEHIIPESLGNKNYTLPKGVVCDKCNNYFAGKIEKPFLDSGTLTAIRHYQEIPNKRGRIPTLPALIFGDRPAVIHRHRGNYPFNTSVSVDSETMRRVLDEGKGELLIPGGGEPPKEEIISRFLAKVGIEAMAKKSADSGFPHSTLALDGNFDDLRGHARYGRPSKWPYSMRRIYADNAKHLDDDGLCYQTLFEFDFLITNPVKVPEGVTGHLYFVLAIFGMEFAINCGCPYIEGYKEWLVQNGDTSPLYLPKQLDDII